MVFLKPEVVWHYKNGSCFHSQVLFQIKNINIYLLYFHDLRGKISRISFFGVTSSFIWDEKVRKKTLKLWINKLAYLLNADINKDLRPQKALCNH